MRRLPSTHMREERGPQGVRQLCRSSRYLRRLRVLTDRPSEECPDDRRAHRNDRDADHGRPERVDDGDAYLPGGAIASEDRVEKKIGVRSVDARADVRIVSLERVSR